MGNTENVPVVDEELESSALSNNSKVAQIFELCLEPQTKEDLDNLLLDFRERIKVIKHREYLSSFDYVRIYALDYVYNHDTVSFCSVSRTLYLYQLISEGKFRVFTADSDYEVLFNALRMFTNVYADSGCEEMLLNASVNAILSGNLGLAFYLEKFRLIKLPSEFNKNSKDIFEVLVNMFNSYLLEEIHENVEVGVMENSVRLHEFLNKLTDTKVNIRRCMLIFCILTTVAEYKVYEKLEVYLEDIKFYTGQKKNSCLQKLMCINIYIHEAMELDLTFKEIENFIEVFLNPFLTEERRKSLMETCKKLLKYSHNYYNIRSLKELARMKVRSMFRKSMSIPEQVNELEIPVTLKEFLNFHGEGIWEVLLTNHVNNFLHLELNHDALEIRHEDRQAIEDENVRHPEDENVRHPEDENVRQPEDENVRQPEDANLSTKEEGNLSV